MWYKYRMIEYSIKIIKTMPTDLNLDILLNYEIENRSVHMQN